MTNRSLHCSRFLQVQELELGVDSRSMSRLLEFLQHSFSGGTDVDKPFELALQRLQKAEWSQVRSSIQYLDCNVNVV